MPKRKLSWKPLWRRPFPSAEAALMETSTEAVKTMGASMQALETSRHSLNVVEVIHNKCEFAEDNGSKSCSSEAIMEASTGHSYGSLPLKWKFLRKRWEFQWNSCKLPPPSWKLPPLPWKLTRLTWIIPQLSLKLPELCSLCQTI